MCSLLLHCKVFTQLSIFLLLSNYLYGFWRQLLILSQAVMHWISYPGSYKVYLYVLGIPASLSWCWNASDAVAFVSHRGPLYIWTISGPDSGVTVHREAHSFLSDISLFRWHPKKKGKVVFGHTDGSLSIFQPGKNWCGKILLFMYMYLLFQYMLVILHICHFYNVCTLQLSCVQT